MILPKFWIAVVYDEIDKGRGPTTPAFSYRFDIESMITDIIQASKFHDCRPQMSTNVANSGEEKACRYEGSAATSDLFKVGFARQPEKRPGDLNYLSPSTVTLGTIATN